MRETKAKVGYRGTRLKLNEVDWSVIHLFAEDTVLLASEWELQKVVYQFHIMCVRGKLSEYWEQ